MMVFDIARNKHIVDKQVLSKKMRSFSYDSYFVVIELLLVYKILKNEGKKGVKQTRFTRHKTVHI